MLSSWTGGPALECAKDSLAIIRVVKPMSELFKIKPAVFVSTGFGKIDRVEVSDAEYGNGDLVLKHLLCQLLESLLGRPVVWPDSYKRWFFRTGCFVIPSKRFSENLFPKGLTED